MALMLILSFATNVWQALAGGSFRTIVRRLWPLFVSACIVTWFGTGLLAQTDTVWSSALLGILLCVYSAVSLLTPPIPSPGRWERWLSPAVGNGAHSGVFRDCVRSADTPSVNRTAVSDGFLYFLAGTWSLYRWALPTMIVVKGS
jgi:uncharacterized membrane protein YfcA